MEKGITIKDIARRFNCSVSTVSRALNNHPAISIETRKNISEYAQENGYQKNAISLSLLNKATFTIGVVVPSINFSHEHTIIEGIQSEVSPKGYMLNIGITNESYQEEKRILERMMANRVDGFLISVAQETFEKRQFDHFYDFLKRKIPIVFIDRTMADDGFSSVATDDYLGAFLATQHLFDTGRKNIAMLSGPENLTVCINRHNGFKDCISKNKGSFKKDWVKPTNFDSESASKPIIELFSNKSQIPDAIFCVNDNIAYGAAKALINLKYSIPNDVSIIGFDNSPVSAYFFPSISSIDRKSFEVGQKAGEIICNMLINKDLSPQKIVLTPHLEIRSSSII